MKEVAQAEGPSSVAFGNSTLDWWAQIELGRLELFERRNVPEALRRFEHACALNRNAGIAWFYLGLALFRVGQFEQSGAALETAEICGYKTPSSAQTRGDANYNLGRFEEAREAYQIALRREPSNVTVRARLGLATVRSGYPEKGLLQLKAEIAALPNTPELHEALIVSYVTLGRILDAAEAAQKKLNEVPEVYSDDYLVAASLWAEAREWSRANAVLLEGLSAHPGDERLQHALREARQAFGAAKLQNS
jgi:tetratricopeptide (TPR) repeat protein